MIFISPLRSEQEASLALRFIWREFATIVRGVELLGELTPKMKDKLLSCGERAIHCYLLPCNSAKISDKKARTSPPL